MKPDPLDYESAERPKELPAWKHLVAILFWTLVVVGVYSLAVAGPIFTVFALTLINEPGVKAFGEPVVTTWQKARFVLFPASLSAVFIPLAFWIRKTFRR